eukprot:10216120-Alexandrium_andersonii.AAC.1
MSASLVGSEMCIRDRLAAVQAVDVKRAHYPPAGGELVPAVLESGRRPVSYTHLTLPTICSV